MARLTRSHLLAAACLVASAALSAHALRTALAVDAPQPGAAAVPMVDAAEAAARRRELAGTYATGQRPGDRRITIHDDGRIEFSEVGRAEGTTPLTDTFMLGRRGKQLCLLPREGELIEVVNLSTLIYYRDTYRRR